MIRFGDWPAAQFARIIRVVTVKKYALSIVLLGALLCACLSACSSSGQGGFDPTLGDLGDGGKKDGSGGGDTICLLNNCDIDRDCADCTEGRHTCLQEEHRCIACQPGSSGTCKQGQYCTKYGDCVPNGSACGEDAQGNPTITCSTDADCLPCNPKHRVCDPGSKKCVGCSTTNTTNCQSTDACVNSTCVAKCPQTCQADADCGQCGATGKEAHACNNHRCAQCSPTQKCANGAACDLKHGVCEPLCGIVGRPEQCNGNQDCAGCKGGATTCDPPVNGGIGACTTPATGCSDLGKGVLVLPPPFSSVTNLCSGDADCRNISADVNVGKALRDLTGFSGIGDANIPYAMHACASVKILNKVSCGVCVPCKHDADCEDVDITKVAGDAFGPIGSVASKLLLDKVFGPNDHKVHMYCQPVVDGYGACVPCSDFLHSCGDGYGPPPAGAPCDHGVCQEGGPLGPLCNQCTLDVCKNDRFCCTPNTGRWDSLCKLEVDQYCTTATCAQPDSCQFKQAGWYCSDQKQFAAFQCDDKEQIQAGKQCLPSEYCHKTGPNPKDQAVLGADGKPQCFAAP